MKIIFMGTPEFAVPALRALAKEHQVVAVYTQAPKPANRGHKETLSPVHLVANQLGIPVYTPKSLRKEVPQAEFQAIDADVAIVVAYGLILPTEILEHKRYGCINIHPSLLPFYRGAAPMQRTILAGERETAMCIMKMDEGIDTGDILMMEKVILDDQITYLELSDKMAHLGADLLLKTLQDIDNIKPIVQAKNGSYAVKISKEEALINWNESYQAILSKIRAFEGWPGTYFTLKDEQIKLLKAKGYQQQHELAVGTILHEKKSLKIACKDGFIEPLVLQRQSKKPMGIIEFLNGFSSLK